MAAHDRGLSPIKLNMVPLRGINDHEIGKMAELVRAFPFHVRFIEYMPMGNSRVTSDQQILIPEIKKRVEAVLGPLSSLGKKKHDGPARRFTAADSLGEIGFISPISSHFCNQCNRLRLTSTGMIRPCLLDNHELDALSIVRNGGSQSDLKALIARAIDRKPLHHSIGCGGIHEKKITSQMSTIGG